MEDRTQRLEALCLAVADGDLAGWDFEFEGDADAARSAAPLRELAALRALFRDRAAGAEAPEPVCPFRWGRLEVLETIGQGSFARVYRARDPVLDREVALKLFRPDRGELEAAELIEEARRHARIHHPRVLAVHGADVQDGVAGLWTDLLEGRTLAAAVVEAGPLSSARLRSLAADLAAGLAAVHEQGMAHGDVTPANVWIDRAGRAILMDFGAAEPVSVGRPARFGSPATMAPELFEGAAPAPGTDAYALGAVLYYAATGRYPLEGADLGALRDAHRRGVRPDFPALRRRARAEAPLVEALLSRTATERPSPRELLARLGDLEAAPQRRFRRRALGAVIVSLAAGLMTTLVLLQRSERALVAAERARFEAQTSKDFLIESVHRMSPFSESGLGTVKAVIDFLVAFGDERLAETPLALGELKVVLGTRLTHFDEVERGLALAREGVATMAAAAPEAWEELTRAHDMLGNALLRLERWDEARVEGERALAYLERVRPTDKSRLGAIQLRGLLVNALEGAGEWQAALAARRALLAERAALVGEDDPRMAVEYNSLGNALYATGRYEEALPVFRRALALLEAGPEKRLYPEAIVSLSIGKCLMMLGRAGPARGELARTAARYTELGLEPGHARFRYLTELEARILRKEGALEKARSTYERLLAESEASPPPQESVIRRSYAKVLFELARPGEALAQLRLARATGAWPAAGHPERLYLDALEAMAQAAADGDVARARQAVTQARRRYEADGYTGLDAYADLVTWARTLSPGAVSGQNR